MTIKEAFTTLPQYILPHHALSKLMSKLTHCENKVWKNLFIRQIIKHYGVNMDEALEPDINAFKSFLTRAHPDWENHWVVAEARKKSEVLAITKKEHNWIGVVDRDEWSQQKIHDIQSEINNLWVLPRYCIENYLIVPEELWLALPTKQQAKITGGVEALNQAIKADLVRWRCHGVLWAVINPLWEGLRTIGFKEALLDPDIATNDEEIKQKLMEWHIFLEPE